MAVPTGIDLEIYSMPWKTAGDIRALIRLDKPKVAADVEENFDGATLDSTLWSYIQPDNSTITVSGGKLTLAQADGNGFPVVWSVPGMLLPYDRSLGWTLEWTIDWPNVTGFGTFFRVCDLSGGGAIVAIRNNDADGYEVYMPDTQGNSTPGPDDPTAVLLENLGADHTTSHDYELIYTPATNTTAAQYELKRDGVSKGTLDATNRHAWYVAIGNGSVQTNVGEWSTIAVSNVHLHYTGAAETQSYPDWTDRETIDGEVWGRLPFLGSYHASGHKRNTIDSMVLTFPMGGFVTGISGDINGPGYRANMFAGYDWVNREVRIETRQSDGHRYTPWLERFRGLCDEPQVSYQNGTAMLTINVREKIRRRLQMYHVVRGYSDAATAIAGVIMGKTWPEIMEDLCQVTGLTATDYNILTDILTPRSWQIMGQSALDAIMELADHGVVAVYRNAGQVFPGRLEVQDWPWGTDTPEIYWHVDADIIGLDWAETDMGLTAQVVETVQHSEQAEFSDIYPNAPVPPFGAVIRHNAAIAQSATDINVSRLLPNRRWKVLNRELSSIVVHLVGQDWLEHNIEAAVIDKRILGLGLGDNWIVDGWDEQWDATQGYRVSVHLVNQHPEKAVMRAALAAAIQMSYEEAAS